MAAGVYVCEMNGSSWAYANQTILSGAGEYVKARYCTMDSATPGDSNPIPIPDSDYTASYWKNHFLMISGGEDGSVYDYTYISSIRWYCDGDLFNWGSTDASGMVCILKVSESEGYGVLSGSYESGCGFAGSSSEGKSGSRLSNHGAFDSSSNAEVYDSLENALMVDNRKIDGPGAADARNWRWSKHIVHQALVGADAQSGNPGTETYTWVWDEVS